MPMGLLYAHPSDAHAPDGQSTLQPGASPSLLDVLGPELKPSERKLLAQLTASASVAKPKYKRQRRYHDAAMRTISCKVGLDAAEGFMDLCRRVGTTRHAALAAYVEQCLVQGRLTAGAHRRQKRW